MQVKLHKVYVYDIHFQFLWLNTVRLAGNRFQWSDGTAEEGQAYLRNLGAEGNMAKLSAVRIKKNTLTNT